MVAKRVVVDGPEQPMHLAVRVAHKYGQDDVERVACGGFSSKRLVKIVHSEGVQIEYSRRRAGTDRLAPDVASGSSLQDVDGIATNTTGPAWKVGALAKVAGLTVRALQPHDSAPPLPANRARRGRRRPALPRQPD
jgi:hypothetical protein